MKRRSLNRVVVGLFALILPLAGAPLAQAMTPPHLAAAEDLVAHVRPEDSSYQHKQGVVHWKGQEGAAKYESHTDCSGLMNHLLEHCYGLSQRDLKQWLGTSRPTAATYHQAIARSHGFQRITRIDQVLPGDVIAIQYPEGSGNSGHLMVVARAARPRTPSAPLVAGARQWEVTVIDSSMSEHGPSDTRHTGVGHGRQGIGQGVLRVYTNANGAIVGHSWSTSHGSEFRDQQTRHMEIGRLVPENQ